MAILNVSASRMELTQLKQKLSTTRRGHALLKNKCDGLLREFLGLYKNTLKLKKYIQNKILDANFHLELAKLQTSEQEINTATLAPKQYIKLKTHTKNILGVNLPKFEIEENINLKDRLNYSFFTNSEHLDKAIYMYSEILEKLILLAEQEKTLMILSNEIEKTRRKVNAIENILIPNYKDTIKFISLKLEENERSVLARLSRLKNF